MLIQALPAVIRWMHHVTVTPGYTNPQNMEVPAADPGCETTEEEKRRVEEAWALAPAETKLEVNYLEQIIAAQIKQRAKEEKKWDYMMETGKVLKEDSSDEE